MSYAQGNLIEASDYNGLNGGSSGASVSGQLNSVWGIGTGTNGYGQTTGANVSIGNTVTASQWATLINNLNNARKHQAGGGYTNLTAPVVGNRVDYLSTLSSRLTDAFTNKLNFNSTRGTTITGSDYTVPWGQALENQEFNVFQIATVTFGSSDQARYFFNAGGALSFFCSATDIAGTNRSNALASVIGIAPTSGLQYISTFGANDNSGSYNYTTRNVNRGYYQAEYANWLELATLYNSAPYGSTYAQIAYDAGSSDTTRGSKGNIVRFRLYMYAPADPDGGTIEISTTSRVDILPPETTYLSNSWGTPTITWSTGP